MEIYMQQTLGFMNSTNPELVQSIVNNSEPKQLKDDSYYFIIKEDGSLEEIVEEII